MDKLTHASRSIAVGPCFEQLPRDVLQHILQYLPIKDTRDTFKLLAKGYLASTDYLRIAGLVQARIRRQAVEQKQAQASQRFARLLGDCMDHRLPACTSISLLMELINLLHVLPTADFPAAMCSVLASGKRLAESAGNQVRARCMERCIDIYQRRSEADTDLPGFEPIDDEEAALAARYFRCDFQMGFEEILVRRMENLYAALTWAGKVADAGERARLLGQMCEHGVTTLASLTQWGRLSFDGNPALGADLRNKLMSTAMQMLPAQEVEGQVALVSLALHVSEKDPAAYERAVGAGLYLLSHAPDSALLSSWPTIAEHFFRPGLKTSLIQRANAWPERQARAVMLRHVARVAFRRNALDDMDNLCAIINELVPPQPALLYELMKRHVDTYDGERFVVVLCELIPSMKALPAGLEKCVLIAAASKFVFAPVWHAPSIADEMQMTFVMDWCFDSYKKMIDDTFIIAVPGDTLLRRQLLALADALLEQAAAIRDLGGWCSRFKHDLMTLLRPLPAKIRDQ